MKNVTPEILKCGYNQEIEDWLETKTKGPLTDAEYILVGDFFRKFVEMVFYSQMKLPESIKQTDVDEVINKTYYNTLTYILPMYDCTKKTGKKINFFSYSVRMYCIKILSEILNKSHLNCTLDEDDENYFERPVDLTPENHIDILLTEHQKSLFDDVYDWFMSDECTHRLKSERNIKVLKALKMVLDKEVEIVREKSFTFSNGRVGTGKYSPTNAMKKILGFKVHSAQMVIMVQSLTLEYFKYSGKRMNYSNKSILHKRTNRLKTFDGHIL